MADEIQGKGEAEEPLELEGTITCAGLVQRFGDKLSSAQNDVADYWSTVVDVALKAVADDEDEGAPDHVEVPCSLPESRWPHLGAHAHARGFQVRIDKEVETGAHVLRVWGWIR